MRLRGAGAALTDAVAAQLHKPGVALTELAYRLQWTRTYLRQFGLIDSARRGHWLLTELGWKTQAVDPAEVVRTVRREMQARAVEKEGQASIFPELATLASSTARASAATPGLRSPTPLFPMSGNVRHCLRILGGGTGAAYLAMASAIWDRRGNPQEQVAWSNPNESMATATKLPRPACSTWSARPPSPPNKPNPQVSAPSCSAWHAPSPTMCGRGSTPICWKWMPSNSRR